MDRPGAWAPLFLAAFGAVLFLAAVVHHAGEFLALNGLVGPLVAFTLDGVPALALVYAGYRLSRSRFTPEHRRTIVVWSLGGGVVFGTAMGVTVLVRLFEGRSIVEPVFPLLVAVEAGALAGLVAGYYNARAHADARRARTVSDALSFLNDLIRHDLRNDLNVIRGRADMIERGSQSSDDTTDHSAVIARKADEALRRIETTRAIADTLVGDPDLEPVDLAGVVAELAAQTETAFEVTVTTDLPDRAPITANAGIRSVVDNLLENAAEHNDADDPQVAVDVTADADTVALAVSDNGPGIPDERKATLFDPQDPETGGGGLSLVRTLVEGYGGTIRVEDNDPRGTTFLVELPRADGE